MDAAAGLLLGAACPGCRTPGAGLCAACAALLSGVEPFAVADPACGVPVWAAAPYADVWRRCVVAYKERTGWWLGALLGELLALGVLAAARGTGVPHAGLVLVPMPSQARAVRERGLDTTLTLARVAARTLAGVGVRASVEPRLRHARRVADQASLGEQGRRGNLVGALAARPVGEGRAGVRVVVDDLTPTGSSLAEACRALAAAGTPASACAVVAATPRRSPATRA